MMASQSTKAQELSADSGANMQAQLEDNMVELNIEDRSIVPTDDQSETDTFDTFTCFPELPHELQLQIW